MCTQGIFSGHWGALLSPINCLPSHKCKDHFKSHQLKSLFLWLAYSVWNICLLPNWMATLWPCLSVCLGCISLGNANWRWFWKQSLEQSGKICFRSWSTLECLFQINSIAVTLDSAEIKESQASHNFNVNESNSNWVDRKDQSHNRPRDSHKDFQPGDYRLDLQTNHKTGNRFYQEGSSHCFYALGPQPTSKALSHIVRQEGRGI